MAAEHTKAAVRQAIAEAFSARERPGDTEIADSRPEFPGYEGDLVAAFLKNRDWRQLCFEDFLKDYPADLTAIPAFMRPEGFAFYLPGFLLMALETDPAADTKEQYALYSFAESLCFKLIAPSPNSLAEQYAIVKDMPEVPEEIKEQLLNPTREARHAVREIVARHERLVELLSHAERRAVKLALIRLGEIFAVGAIDDSLNFAQRALAATWARF